VRDEGFEFRDGSGIAGAVFGCKTLQLLDITVLRLLWKAKAPYL